MNLNELMNDIHANAAAHGWWDTPRSAAEIRALIHSEWSEALEEDRAGRPGVWYACMNDYYMCHPRCMHADRGPNCPDRASKPEGWAVELIDGCIRILDYFGYMHYQFAPEITLTDMVGRYIHPALGKWSFCELIDVLHNQVCSSNMRAEVEQAHLNYAIGYAFAWMISHGFEPEKILLEKHEYNKGRPYKHGKQY